MTQCRTFSYTNVNLRLRLFRRKMLFGKQLIFQKTFSEKLTHFPVFGNNHENSWKTFLSVWYAQKKIFFQNTFF
jgi:hypothetical protein